MDLDKHIKENCDNRLMGTLAFGVKETYSEFHELVKRTTILQSPEMKQTHGYIVHGMIDVMLKQILVSSGINHNLKDKTTCKFKNGHTYFLAEVDGALITPKKLYKPKSFPKKAKYRTELSYINKEISLFDDYVDDSVNLDNVYNNNESPFLLLTYGGKNQQVEWINLALPDFEMKEWIDRVDITNSPVILPNQKQVKEELQLTFTQNAERLIEEGHDNAREGNI